MLCYTDENSHSLEVTPLSGEQSAEIYEKRLCRFLNQTPLVLYHKLQFFNLKKINLNRRISSEYADHNFELVFLGVNFFDNAGK